MCALHGGCFGLEAIKLILTKASENCILVPLVFDMMCIISYQLAIFYIQIVYVSTDKEHTD